MTSRHRGCFDQDWAWEHVRHLSHVPQRGVLVALNRSRMVAFVDSGVHLECVSQEDAERIAPHLEEIVHCWFGHPVAVKVAVVEAKEVA